MKTAYTEAKEYFDTLWKQEKGKLETGDIVAASMEDGVTIPVDYCVSTIARIQEQRPGIIRQIQRIQKTFQQLGTRLFFYPGESLHITMYGCTQRTLLREHFTSERIKPISEVCSKVLRGSGVQLMTLRGVNTLGSQIFIQALPHDRKWAQLRLELEKSLLLIGEEPLSFSNKAPIQLNIMRIISNDSNEIMQVIEIVEEMRDIEIGELDVSNIELVITDYVVSMAHTTIIEKFVLDNK